MRSGGILSAAAPAIAALALAAGCTTARHASRHPQHEFEFPFVHDYSVANRTTFAWDDSFLLAPSTTYSQDIAGPLCAIAASSYGFRLGMDVKTLAGMGFEAQNLFRKYGEAIDYRDPKYGKDQTGLTIAAKKSLLDGELRDVLLIVVRGTFGRSEWLSNMNACNEWGRSANPDPEKQPHLHEGFSRATDCVFEILARYVRERGINLAAAKILVTGHSRGAAVANLVGARLNDLGRAAAPGQFAGIKRENVFVYTFAPPNTVLSDDVDCRASAYNNIFNVINPEDIVPTVPISRWQASRYGIDLHLKNYDALSLWSVWFDPAYNSMKNAFRDITGYEWWHTPFGTNSTQLVPAILGAVAPRVEDLYAVPPEQRRDGNMTSVHSILETLIYRSMEDPGEDDAAISLGGDVNSMTRAYSTVSSPKEDVEADGKYFRVPDGRDFSFQPGMFDLAWRLSCMHATQTYIGWMKAAEKYGPQSIYKNWPRTERRVNRAAPPRRDRKFSPPPHLR